MSTIVYVATDGTGAILYAGTDPDAALIYGRPHTPDGHNMLRMYLDGRRWAAMFDLYSDHYTTDAPDVGNRCACGRNIGWDGHPYFHHYPFPV